MSVRFGLRTVRLSACSQEPQALSAHCADPAAALDPPGILPSGVIGAQPAGEYPSGLRTATDPASLPGSHRDS